MTRLIDTILVAAITSQAGRAVAAFSENRPAAGAGHASLGALLALAAWATGTTAREIERLRAEQATAEAEAERAWTEAEVGRKVWH